MTKYKQNERIPFTDDLMFSLVVRDENICRQLLERILPDEKFGEIRIEGTDDDLYVETQKSIKFPLGAHGVRLDAFIKSGNVWAEIELQTYTGDHIAKRSMDLGQYLRHKKLNFYPSITYAERIISYAARASSSTCCGVL